jgi:Holliday junction resolvase RusA-like endonuclease
MTLHAFTIPVAPKPLQTSGKRLVVVGGKPRFFKDKKASDYQKEIAFRARKHAPKSPHECAILLSLDFFLPRPVRAKADLQATKRPDLDNLIKGTQDALSEFWKDDSQIIHLMSRKFYAAPDESPRIVVRITEAVGY